MKTIQVEVPRELANVPVDRNLARGGAAATVLTAVPVEDLVSAVKETITLFSSAITPGENGPESCAIKFGLKVSASGNVVLAKVGSELNFEVSVTWKR